MCIYRPLPSLLSISCCSCKSRTMIVNLWYCFFDNSFNSYCSLPKCFDAGMKTNPDMRCMKQTKETQCSSDEEEVKVCSMWLGC